MYGAVCVLHTPWSLSILKAQVSPAKSFKLFRHKQHLNSKLWLDLFTDSDKHTTNKIDIK